ncbi:uncharacterized protein [Paramormyrops kingsleyae]|nr:uncharacterized protein LOC111860983 isoform X2 [Paramormyrops kingsleyae]
MEPPAEVKSRITPPLQATKVKAHLQAAQELLVDALYNMAPLLDRMLAKNLLPRDSYQMVQAERTAADRARRLLEVVQAQMDDEQAGEFLDCLKACQSNYPRLRAWLHGCTDLQGGLEDFQCGPSVCRLRTQLGVLCKRLGVSVLPVSLQLFSSGILTQLELDSQQAEPTPYQQSQRLLLSCLSKGERACAALYKALCQEDPQLGAELQGWGSSPCCETPAGHFSVAVVESGAAAMTDWPTGDTWTQDMPRSLTSDRLGTWEATHLASERKDVLQEAMALLGVATEAAPQFNMCELGVLLGLRRADVRDRLLEKAAIDDVAQLAALVELFLEKTQDVERLLQRLQQCDTQGIQLSGRGTLLLELLGEAERLLQGSHTHVRAEHIFTILMWDMLAEMVEEPWVWQWAEPWEGLLGVVQRLRGVAGGRAEAELLAELEECWDGECRARGLLQAVPVLAQLLRDLYPRRDSLQLLGPSHPQGMAVTCRPRMLRRVTRFSGVPHRAITRALVGLPLPSPSLALQYHTMCQAVTRLLERVCPTTQGITPPPDLALPSEAVRHALSQPAFGSDAFDAGMRQRLLALLEFDPAALELPSLLPLHKDTVRALKRYLLPAEHHGFLLHPLALWLPKGGAHLCWARSISGPVAIDDGLEETFRFCFSDATLALVCLCCHGYQDGQRFQAAEPRCIRVLGLGGSDLVELRQLGGQVLWEGEGFVWVRETELKLLPLAGNSSAQLEEAGVCFLLRSLGPRCDVTFVYKRSWISAMAKSDCEVL